MQKIRIGFIGAGLIAHGHALSLRSLIEGNTFPAVDVKLAGVYDSESAKASVFAEQHAVTTAVSDVEELFADSAINVIYICTPTAYHKSYFLRAAAAGKHIFVEKPLAFSTSEIKEMIAAQKKAGVAAQVGLVLRFEPIFWYIKQLITRQREVFGSLLHFHFRSDQEWPLCGSFHDSQWRADPREAFAGCLFEHSIHDVDLIRYLFGEVSELSAFVNYRSDQSAGQIEDAVTANFSLSDGGSGNLTSLYHRIKGRDVRRLEIIFERAAIILDDYTPGGFTQRYRELAVEISGQKRERLEQAAIDRAYYESVGRPSLLLPEMVSAYRYQALAFLRSLIKRQPVFPNLEAALQAHRLIESIYSFARRGQALHKVSV
ncbi:MAG: Gfo/Idh/MocA family oxidoreductase [Bacillota bacterium]